MLVIPGRGDPAPEGSIWLLDLSLRLHHLAPDPLTYWRLMLVHLGLPQWHHLAAGTGLTPWAKVGTAGGVWRAKYV